MTAREYAEFVELQERVAALRLRVDALEAAADRNPEVVAAEAEAMAEWPAARAARKREKRIG